MDAWWFGLAMLGGSLGWPLLAAGVALSALRATRRYVLPVVAFAIAAGAIAGVVMDRGLSGIPWKMAFWGTFSFLVIPLGVAALAIALVRRHQPPDT